jgi:hypothetical protein
MVTGTGGQFVVSTGLRDPDIALGFMLASLAGGDTMASFSCQFSLCTGSYAYFKIVIHGAGTWAQNSYAGINWMAMDAF